MFQRETGTFRRISKYSGLDFRQLLNLPYSYFRLLDRDSWIDSWMRTDAGREVLKNIWRLQQTEPDMDAVHRFQGREETICP